MSSRRTAVVVGLMAMSATACASTAPAGSARSAASTPVPAVSPSSPPRPSSGVFSASGGIGSSEIETTTDGSAPVTVSGSVSGSRCATAATVAVHVTLSITRDGLALPGDGRLLALSHCGPFSEDLHPSAGRVRVRADVVAGDGISVDLAIASAGQVSRSTVGGGGGNSHASAISVN